MAIDKIPAINSRIACIVDREAKDLAAVISSYLFEVDTYIPLFIFGKAVAPRVEDPAFMSDNYVAYVMLDHASVLVHNAIVRMRDCEYIILAGLSASQKTFLDVSGLQKVVEIATVAEVDEKLKPLVSAKHGTLRCT